VKITPLPEAEKVRSMTAYVDDAVAKGAHVVNAGGGTACETLYFPAVLYPVSPDAEIYHSEQFGPVVPVCPYRHEEEFLHFVAASAYGQQISIFGKSPEKIGKLTRELANQTSRININCQCRRAPDALPFTGRKDSGNATLSVTATLRSFSIPSVVATPSRRSCEEMIETIWEEQYSESKERKKE
jgi:acyl-CoA reductase-like NAD-dependent aldehyde dehydrogenase